MLDFPFEAEVLWEERDGKSGWEKVDVLGMPTKDTDFDTIQEISLKISPKGSKRVSNVGISELKNAKGSLDVGEAFQIWNFCKSGAD